MTSADILSFSLAVEFTHTLFDSCQRQFVPDAIHDGSEEQAHGLIHNRYTGIYRLLINYIYKSIHMAPKIDTFGRPIDLSGHKEIVHDELW